MKNSICIACGILAGLLQPASGQEEASILKDPKTQQVSQAYAFILSQNYLLNRVASEYPDLGPQVEDALYAFKASAFGKGSAALEDELKTALGLQWSKTKNITEQCASANFRTHKLTHETAKQYVEKVKLRAKGDLPESIRNILLSVNPAYVNSPGAELADGWKQTFSTKAHPKSEGAEITLALPLSWSKREGNQVGIVQVFRSGAGHGPIVCTIFCKKVGGDSEGDATLQDMNGFFTNENLVMMAKSMGRMIEARQITIAGAPGGVITYDSAQEMLGVMTEVRSTDFAIIHKKHFIKVTFALNKQMLNGMTFDEAQKAYYPTYLAIMSNLARY